MMYMSYRRCAGGAAVTRVCRRRRSNTKQLIDGRMRPRAVRAGATQSNGNQSNVACWFQQLQGVGPGLLEPQSDRCFPSCLFERGVLPSFCPPPPLGLVWSGPSGASGPRQFVSLSSHVWAVCAFFAACLPRFLAFLASLSLVAQSLPIFRHCTV